MVATPTEELFDGTFNIAATVVASFIALSLYNAFELALLVFFTFKRWKGLYFWSMIVASASVMLYSIGFMTFFYHIGSWYAGSIVNNIGWITMVSSQSIVLYSRIHLVLSNRRVLRGILITIIVNGIVLYIPTTILQYGSYASDTTVSDNFKRGGYIVEKIQMTAFSIQEFVISGIYIRQILQLYKTTFDQDKQEKIYHLLAVHTVVICLDIALLTLEYTNHLVYQQSFKSVAYSMKLKMEFAVLGDLIESVRRTAAFPTHISAQDGSSLAKNPGIVRPTMPVQPWSSSEELVSIPKRDIGCP